MPSGEGDVLPGGGERGDAPIAAALGLLSVMALIPQASTVHFHSSGVKSMLCPLASSLGDIALGWLYWPALRRKALLPLRNSFTAKAAAGGRSEGGGQGTGDSPLHICF